MTTTQAIPVAILLTIPLVLVVDLFPPEEATQSFLRRRPCIEDEPDKRYIRARTTGKEELELAWRRSRHDEGMR